MKRNAIAALLICAFLLTGCSSDTKTIHVNKSPDKQLTDQDHEGKLRGVPQSGFVLGSPSAPVKIVEYGDLQCTYCKTFEQNVMPQVVSKLVRTGKASYMFRNLPVVGEGSTAAARGAMAAIPQDRYYDFIQAFYTMQQPEGTSYVTSSFLDKVAQRAGLNIKEWHAELGNENFDEILVNYENTARAEGLKGTPSLVITGPGGKQIISGAVLYSKVAGAVRKVSR